jgi:hypothetical protein
LRRYICLLITCEAPRRFENCGKSRLIAAAVVTSTIFGAVEGPSFLAFAFEPPHDTAKTQ